MSDYDTIKVFGDKPVWVGWETEAEWELEQRAFHWNKSWSEEETRNLINDLWRQYCAAAEIAFNSQE